MGYCNPIRPLTIVGLFMWLLISILLIAAAGSTKWLSVQGAQTGGFQYCTTGSGGTCYNIDSSCKFGSGNAEQFNECSKFQAFRAFLVMGLLTALFTTILAYTMFFLHRMKSSPLLLAYHVLSAVTWLFIMISWSVFAGWASDESVGGSKSDGFGLAVSAWVFIFIAWPAFAAACMFEEGAPSSLGGGMTTSSSSSLGAKSTDAGTSAGSMQMQQPGGAPLQVQPQQMPAQAMPAAPVQHSYQVPPAVPHTTAGYPYSGETSSAV